MEFTSDYDVASPAVVLAAVAARTQRIRLASGVTVLSVADPVRVYGDFAQLDVLSGGRAEVVAGRSAFPEPFAPQVRAAIGKASPDKASTTA
jgi:alkanesulfonate monooxygenase SsuD/methylene tetrahydromethanopterin reductase-like flavin-dependent oxidoreductase (luciferase family)